VEATVIDMAKGVRPRTSEYELLEMFLIILPLARVPALLWIGVGGPIGCAAGREASGDTASDLFPADVRRVLRRLHLA